MSGILAMFLTEYEMERVRFLEDGTVEVDVHRLSKNEMKKLFRNISAVFRNGVDMLVIHGYNNGTLLKQTLRNDNIFTRTYSIESQSWNPGRTMIHIKAS